MYRLKYHAFLSARPVWNCKKVDEPNGQISQNVWVPPTSKACEHQKLGVLDCTCAASCPPDGFNISIYNDKKSKNRWLHIPTRGRSKT